MYPNPFSQDFNIEIPPINDKILENIWVINTLGEIINAKIHIEYNNKKTKIFVQPKENINSGIYHCILAFTNKNNKIITLIKK